MFDPSVFWSAFAAAGFLTEVRFQPQTGAPVDGIAVRLNQPDAMLLDGQSHSSQYEVEYQTSDMPTLKVGDSLVVAPGSVRPPSVAAGTYVVRQKPMSNGDGFYSTAMLSKS